MGKIHPDQQNKPPKIISARIHIAKCNISRRLAHSRHTPGPWKKIVVENSSYSRNGHKKPSMLIGSFFGCPLFTVSSLFISPPFQGSSDKAKSWAVGTGRKMVLPCYILSQWSPWKREDGIDLASLPLILRGLSLASRIKLLWDWRYTSEVNKLEG